MTQTQTTTKTPPKKAPTKKATNKPAAKTTRKAVAAKPKAAKAPTINTHIEAGVNVAKYNGPSSFVNANRTTQVLLRDGIDPGKVTDRARKGLYALREAYATKPFTAKGFDNGVLRDLLAAKLISVSGGEKVNVNGKEYMRDGEQPLKVKITAAGMTHGKTA